MTLDKPLLHRWFHTVVVTGASLSACGGNETIPATDHEQMVDAASPESGPDDRDNPPADTSSFLAGGSDDEQTLEDARDDFRCCFITR
jgi:hypothetical protein